MVKRSYPQCILFGDSIIQYSSFLRDGYSFGAALSEHCQRRLDVINRGLSGYTTSNALSIIDNILPTPSTAKIDYLLILFGANDACLPESPTGQHVPLAEYKKNLRSILTHPTVTDHKPTILLVTPPPINEVHLEQEDLAKGYSTLTRHQSTTAEYAIAVREIARDFHDIILVDLWAAMMEEAQRLATGYLDDQGGTTASGSLTTSNDTAWRNLLVDGLHFTGAGYKVFFDAVVPLIGTTWAQEPPTEPSWTFPHWSVAPRIDRE